MHWDHDIHGVAFSRHPDGSISVDDCDCPPGCPECVADDVPRMAS